MINVGGSSYTNGIKFIATNYSVNFETHGNITKIFLQKNESKNTSKTLDFMNKIPFVRGIVSIIRNIPFLFFIELFYLLSDILSVTKITESKSSFSLLNILILCAIAIILIKYIWYIITKVFKNIKSTWQYHGAEHKVIMTNDKDIPINLENCRKSSRISDNCGTMLVCLYLIIYIIIKIFSMAFNIVIWDSLSFLICWVISYELFLLKRNTHIIRWIFKFGYWFQEHVCTLEPSDFQLKHAIEAFNLLEKAETGKIPDKELDELLRNGKQLIY